jgi:hypothetical protein
MLRGRTKYWLTATMHAQLSSAAIGSVGFRMGFNLQKRHNGQAGEAEASVAAHVAPNAPHGMPTITDTAVWNLCQTVYVRSC